IGVKRLQRLEPVSCPGAIGQHCVVSEKLRAVVDDAVAVSIESQEANRGVRPRPGKLLLATVAGQIKLNAIMSRREVVVGRVVSNVDKDWAGIGLTVVLCVAGAGAAVAARRATPPVWVARVAIPIAREQ